MASSFSKRARGLVKRGADYLAPGTVLCFVPCSSVHTCFMRRCIDVAFLDDTGRVVRSISGMRPWRLAVCPKATWACERFGENDVPWLEEGDEVFLVVSHGGREGEMQC